MVVLILVSWDGMGRSGSGKGDLALDGMGSNAIYVMDEMTRIALNLLCFSLTSLIWCGWMGLKGIGWNGLELGGDRLEWDGMGWHWASRPDPPPLRSSLSR